MNARFSFFLFFVVFGMLCKKTNAQIPVLYQGLTVDATFPPLSFIPTDKSIAVELPDGLTYLTGKDVIARYWSYSGLTMANKIAQEHPDIVMKIIMAGAIIIDSEDLVKPHPEDASRKTYLRQYTFKFPTEIVVMDGSGATIKTIPVYTEVTEFKRRIHRNFFNPRVPALPTDEEIGFDSPEELSKYSETTVLKRLESQLLAETFVYVKQVIVHVFGQAGLHTDVMLLQPDTRHRSEDFSGYANASTALKKGIDGLNSNAGDTTYLTFLEQANVFYAGEAKKMQSRRTVFLPVIVYWNLALINVLKGETKQADQYYHLFMKAHWPEGNSFSEKLAPSYKKLRAFYTLRQSQASLGK